MISQSIGDHARSRVLLSGTSRLKHLQFTLTKELASEHGYVDDLGQRLQGNFRALHNLEERFNSALQYERNATHAHEIISGQHDMLLNSKETISKLANSMLRVRQFSSPAVIADLGNEAAESLGIVVARLNSRYAAQYLFSGTVTDTTPLLPAREILDKLVDLTRGSASAAEVADRVSEWFDTDRGDAMFLNEAFRNASDQVRQIAVSDGLKIDFDVTAADSEIRNMLKGLATAALIDRGVLTEKSDERVKLLETGQKILSAAELELIGKIARIGVHQKEIETAKAENLSLQTVLKTTRNDMIGIDQEATVVAQEEVDTHLKVLNALTARLSKLTLVDFLR